MSRALDDIADANLPDFKLHCNNLKLTHRYYVETNLTPNEINMLSDAIEVYSYITFEETKNIISKLNNLLPKSEEKNYNDGTRYAVSSQKLDSKMGIHVLDHIGKLRNVIKNKKKVEIVYGEYIGEVLQKKNGYPKIISPHALMWSNGYYYLIAKSPSHDEPVNFRVDRIIKVNDRITDSADPINDPECLFTDGAKKIFLPSKYRATHAIMYSGKIEEIEIKCINKPWMISTLKDCFGLDIKIVPLSLNKDWITVRFKSTTPGVVLWATQYCNHAIVLSPQSVVDAVRKNLQAGIDNYKNIYK